MNSVSINLKSTLTRFIRKNCKFQWKQQKRSYTESCSRAPTELFDLVCIGGGTAGLSLLASLRSSPSTSNFKVGLIDNKDIRKTCLISPPSTQFSSRCSSLTPSSVRFLNQIGVWNHIDLDRTQAYQEMQVWDGVSGARIEFSKKMDKENTIACMTENINLLSALVKRVEELGNVSFFENDHPVEICLGKQIDDTDLKNWPTVRLSSGKKLAARLLVGADGADSSVRAFAGIDSEGWDYGRMGVVAILKSKDDRHTHTGFRTAYQRFLPTGPVALLPLPGCYSSLVWTTTLERASQLKNLLPQDFVAMVNAAFRLTPTDLSYMHTMKSKQSDELQWRSQHTYYDSQRVPLEMIEVQSESVASFSLKLRHADTYIGERVALVGDAAHSIHPLAGQGLNQGLADVEGLTKVITNAISHGEDIGAQMALEAYNAKRYAANQLLLGVVDKLHKLYSVENGPLVAIRSIGLRAVNSLGPLKNFLIDQAAGAGAKI